MFRGVLQNLDPESWSALDRRLSLSDGVICPTSAARDTFEGSSLSRIVTAVPDRTRIHGITN